MSNKETLSIQEKFAVVDEWVRKLSESDSAGEIDRGLLREVFERRGANFEISEEAKRSLKKWTNEGNGPGIKAVWGSRITEYKAWTRGYCDDYEKEHGVTLPHIKFVKKSGEVSIRKNSAMLRFLYLLTRFAAFSETEDPRFDFNRLKWELEARAQNGRLRARGIGDEQKEKFEFLVRPDTGEAHIPSSFPPGFPQAAWEKIKSWSQ